MIERDLTNAILTLLPRALGTAFKAAASRRNPKMLRRDDPSRLKALLVARIESQNRRGARVDRRLENQGIVGDAAAETGGGELLQDWSDAPRVQ